MNQSLYTMLELDLPEFKQAVVARFESQRKETEHVGAVCQERFESVLREIDFLKTTHAGAIEQNTFLTEKCVSGIGGLSASIQALTTSFNQHKEDFNQHKEALAGTEAIEYGFGKAVKWSQIGIAIVHKLAKLWLPILALSAAIYAILDGKWPKGG